MYDIDRIVTIIKPKQPMLDWINNHPHAEGTTHTLDEIRHDCTALLIPILENEEEATALIAGIYEGIFDNELASWYLDETTWPEHRTFEMFQAWFDLEFHSLVFDLLSDDDEDAATDTSLLQ